MDVIYFVMTNVREQRAALCRWVERLEEKGGRVQVVTDSHTSAQYLDEMLWTFSDTSFVPHRVISGGVPGEIPETVAITTDDRPLEGFSAVVCDRAVSLEALRAFGTAVHFVAADDPDRVQASRRLWKQAKDSGFHVEHIPAGSSRLP
jgi:DNA polymerase-3 subunit chi